ncbi:MAG: hypothetical protein LBT89_03735 [Planctomycetaceae bacterium]|jgi:hypothetical protein|nr:hypothetical protein [Planctomycetaceae bacterium]
MKSLNLLLVLVAIPVVAVFAADADAPSAKPVFVPGSLITIPPSIDFEDLANRQDIPELLAAVPEPADDLKDDIRFQKETWAKQIRYNRGIWCLQFSCKPVRIVEVEIPNKEGRLDKKAVWYLVYNVKNLGNSEVGEDGTIKQLNSWLGSAVYEGDQFKLPVPEDKNLKGEPRNAPLEVKNLIGKFVPTPGPDINKSKPILFQPQFVLTIHRLVKDTAVTNNSETGKTEYHTETAGISYKDRIIPLALPLIIRREGMKAIPETSISFPAKEIAAGQDYWGVAMWTDIDPRVNEFSVYVSGLTNAYQQFDKQADNKNNKLAAAPLGRTLKRKVLKLDWQRLGDKYTLSDAQIRFGAKDEKVKKDIFDLKGDYNQDGKVDDEEFQRYKNVLLELGKDVEECKDARELEKVYVSDFDRAEYNRVHQEWLQASYGFSWLYL